MVLREQRKPAALGGPELGYVIGNGGGSGPHVAITGNVATIIEIIEHAVLTSELVLIGRDVLPVHRQGWIAIAGAEITENLVVGAIFSDDVDDVPDLVLTGGEADAVGIAAGGVGFGDLLRERRQICRQVCKGDARERAVNHSWRVRITGTPVGGFADGFWIRPGAATLGACDKEILTSGGDNGGIPLGGNETDGLERLAGRDVREIENSDAIGNGIGGKQRLLVGREREIFRIAAAVLLSRELCRKIGDRFSGRGVEDRDLVAVGEGHEKPGVVAIEQKSGRMRPAGKRRSGLAKRNEAADTPLQQVQLRDHGSIPKRDEASPAIAGDHRRIRKGGRAVLARREIEAGGDLAVTRIQE